MSIRGITLRGLEVFEALARTGSVARAAALTGLSQPAVSQQMRKLETALGSELVDRGRRPMRLTPAGRSFLVHAEAILAQLRLAEGELTMMDLGHLGTLSIGLIDDFDNDLTPRLATILAENLSHARFRLVTAPSTEISRAVQNRDLHLGIAASTGEVLDDVVEYPLVRDPFIVVTPRGHISDAEDLPAALSRLPLLRYSGDQLISRQIEAHLTRHKIGFEDRFRIGSHFALMAMVAHRIGWAITTPLGYMRTRRLHDAIDALPLPFVAFSRTISLFAGAGWAGRVPRDLARTVQGLIQSEMIDPATARLPWLKARLQLLGS